MEEVTLLEALCKLHNHKKKSEPISFTITFDGDSRVARFGKTWNKVMREWHYIVQDQAHAPCLCYTEQTIVSAICSIPGISRQLGTVKFHVRADKKAT